MTKKLFALALVLIVASVLIKAYAIATDPMRNGISTEADYNSEGCDNALSY